MNPLLDPYLIPPAIRAGLDRYVKHGIAPGDCLRAILSNDLIDAYRRADESTWRAMPAIVAFIVNDLPTLCYGSRERVDQWIEMHMPPVGDGSSTTVAT